MDRSITDQLLPALFRDSRSQPLAAYEVAPAADGYFLTNRFEPALLLLLGEDSTIHDLRKTTIQLRINWGHVLEGPPLVFTPTTLARHVHLFPLFREHLLRHSRRLEGAALPLERGNKPHPIERLTFLIAEAIEAASALAPAKAQPQALRSLQRLAQQLSGKTDDSTLSPAELFARVQIYLRLFVDSLPSMVEHPAPLVKSTDKPNVLAFYEDGQKLLVIIPPLSANLLQQIDWSALDHPAASHLTALNVATTDQIYLSIQAQRPLDYFLGTFRRLWGANVLNGLAVSARAVFRQAARKPALILNREFLGAYLLAPDAKAVHGIIHDYQNKLLNLRLEHDLLCRMLNLELSEPDTPLPRRDEPLSVRIDAIAAHFNWWADLYVKEMEGRPVEQKLSPP